MSNSNRSDHKTPNPKLARYLHRIEQLIGNRGRTPSPLSSRSSKPLKPNSLDHYLKYQLTFKILCNFFDKTNKSYMRHFFNMLRSREPNSKIQKIYKFVPIQKTECAHIVVDTGITTKILVNILKTKIKDNMKYPFQLMKGQFLAQSQIINTARSNRSNILPLSLTQKKHHTVGVALQNIYLNRKAYSFNNIKIFALMMEKQQGKKQQHLANQQQNNSVYLFKIKYLNKLIDNLVKAALKQGMNRIIAKKHQNQIKQHTKIMSLQKLTHISTMKWLSDKNQLLFQIRKLKSYKQNQIKQHERKQKQRLEQQKIKIQQLMKESLQSNQKNSKSASNITIIEQASNWIGMMLISLLFRRKLYAMRKLQRFTWRKNNTIMKIQKMLEKKLILRLSNSLQMIKQHVVAKEQAEQRIKNRKKLYNWKALGILVNFQKYFVRQLKRPFKKIKQLSQDKFYVGQGAKLILYLFYKNKIYQCFQRLKQFKTNEQLKDQQNIKQIQRQQKRQKQQFLPKVLVKIITLRIIDAFIKTKNTKVKQASKNAQNSQWSKDIKNFIIQRDRFNKNLLQNYNKIGQMIKIDPNLNLKLDRQNVVLNNLVDGAHQSNRITKSAIIKTNGIGHLHGK